MPLDISEVKIQLNVIELLEQSNMHPIQKHIYINKKDVLEKAIKNNHLMIWKQ